MDATSKLIRLIELLKDKKKLLSEMKELTKSQKDNITEDKIESLNDIIGEKGTIIKKIDEIDEEFSSIYNSLKDMLKVSSLEQAEVLPRNLLTELKDNTKEVTGLLGEIAAIDDENRKMAKELKDSLAAEIKKINNSKQANAIYRSNTSFQGSYFIDKKN